MVLRRELLTQAQAEMVPTWNSFYKPMPSILLYVMFLEHMQDYMGPTETSRHKPCPVCSVQDVSVKARLL